MKKTFFLILAICFICFLVAPLWAQPDEIVIKERVRVAGAHVCLGDIAKISGPNAKQLSGLKIMDTPYGVTGATFSREYIKKRVTTQVDLPVNLAGSMRVHISQRLFEVPDKVLSELFKEQVMQKSPWRDRGRIIIEDVRIPLNIRVDKASLSCIRAKCSPHEDFLGLVTMFIHIGSGRMSKKVHVSGHVRVMAKVPVAASEIRRSHVLTRENIEMKEMDITSFPRIAMEMDACLGMRTRSNIHRGSPFNMAKIEKTPLVCRGDRVVIEASDEHLRVTGVGIALKDGNLSDHIPVRNASSGQRVVGTVVASSKIKVVF